MTGWSSTWVRNRGCRPRAGDGHGCGLHSMRGGPLMSTDHAATLRRFQNPAVRQSAALDDLVRQAVFGSAPEREQARWLIWEMGQQAGVRPASIHELYLARGRGEVPPFTTPAINVRVLAYDSARAIFRAARRLDVGAVICEIARSEIGYTEQRPAEYVAVMTAAALREGFTGPLFIQGDHVQVNAKKYAADPEAELQALRTLIEEELHARSEEHTSELQSRQYLVCRLLLEKKKSLLYQVRH